MESSCCRRLSPDAGASVLALAPFSLPAHQTGRADFRHPAFRLISPQGTRRGTSRQVLQAQHAALAMNDIEREPTIAAPLHLVPSCEECAYAIRDILVDALVGLAVRPVAEVVRPASQGPVQPVSHF